MEVACMWYVTGDTHGNIKRFTSLIDPCMKQGDVIIVLGDWGFIFEPNESKEMFMDWLEQERDYYNICFVDGNHENFDRLNTEYPVEIWNGGKVHRIRRNIRHLMRGQVYTVPELGNKRIFTMGGAYSFDAAKRMEGCDWFPAEMPCQAEYDEAQDNLQKADYQVDYILTHACPENTLPFFAADYYPKMRSLTEPHEKPISNFLQWIAETVSYSRWYFGHMHKDRELWKNQTVVLNAVRELETGKMVNEEAISAGEWCL